MPTFQQFYSDTLSSRFIKSLLAQTSLPVFDCVIDGDHLVKGCYYVYKQFIIKCEVSGVLAVSPTEKLVPSNTLYPSVFLMPATGFIPAMFKVIKYATDVDPQTHGVYRSTTTYYDPETHYHLGRYLRYLYTTTGLNLFPYYNSYNYTQFSDIQLTVDTKHSVGVARAYSTSNTIVAVPILFGHTYTVAVDCPSQVLMRACIHDNSGYVEESNLPTSLAQTLSTSGQVHARTQFQSPVTFRIESSDVAAVMLQRNLYLVIQLPLNSESAVVVQENYKQSTGVQCDSDGVRILPELSNSSLLRINTHKTFAFSNRLIEYLLDLVITQYDLYSKNIASVQEYLANLYPEYEAALVAQKRTKGFWDEDIKRLIQDVVECSSTSDTLYDQDGNANRDLLALLQSKGVH